MTAVDDDPTLALIRTPDWQRDALCVEHPEIASAFFPEKGKPTAPAKALCRTCLVQRECLAYALDERVGAGIWGASAPLERDALRRAGVTGEMVRRYGSNVPAARDAAYRALDLLDLLR